MNKTLALLTTIWAAMTQASGLPPITALDQWSEQSFVGQSEYRVDGESLVGTANGTASALGVEVRVPAGAKLAWRWSVEQLPDLGQASEQSKQGDDFGARVYVVRKGAFGLLSTRSLVYVWSQSKASGEMWESPYTGKVMMIAVQPDTAELGQWHSVERDIAKDWHQAFGDELDRIDGVAFMVDADNTQTQARARFAELELR